MEVDVEDMVSSSSSSISSFGGLTSAAMSQVALQKGDEESTSKEYLPENQFNQSGQQIDLRETTSWKLKLEEVQTPELLEVFTINTMAPFILNGRLKPLMCSEACKSVDRYIINVSAMEGKFYRFKTPNHPHTNMAKAAVNMMTRTSASDYAKSNIYMNAVDTGWINDENPLKDAQRIFKDHHFQTPIDEIDAASRIVDPIFQGVLYGAREFGKFWKDYKETEW
jgi:NAD(P)-dependent dehydrogenase (short-subunit alcohol dehydrogenase family)